MTHDSIKILLDSIEREGLRRLTHSELARAMNVSEQVITNWAKRGISAEGALTAQMAFHKDANYLLGRVESPQMALKRPNDVQPAHGVAMEPPAIFTVTTDDQRQEAELVHLFRSLPPDAKTACIAYLKGFNDGRGTQPDTAIKPATIQALRRKVIDDDVTDRLKQMATYRRADPTSPIIGGVIQKTSDNAGNQFTGTNFGKSVNGEPETLVIHDKKHIVRGLDAARKRTASRVENRKK